ncbi:MAG: hypothetical protein ACYC7A_21915 [Thermoanaerobaculia bacterium]
MSAPNYTCDDCKAAPAVAQVPTMTPRRICAKCTPKQPPLVQRLDLSDDPGQMIP